MNRLYIIRVVLGLLIVGFIAGEIIGPAYAQNNNWKGTARVVTKEFAVRVKVSGESDLRALRSYITEFDDVKITTRGRFIYNQDNGHVTVICNSSQLGILQNLNFTILNTQPYVRTQNVNSNVEKQPGSETDEGGSIPYQFGWPRQSALDAAWYNSSTTIADMNGDGGYEIFATHSFAFSSNPLLYGYKSTGAFVLGFPYTLPFGSLQSSGSMEIPALGDIDGDGQMEVVHADENGNIFAHNFDGSMVTGFPYNTGGTNEHTVPALVDVNNDDKLEILITSRDRDDDLNAQIHLLSWSAGTVTQMAGFPVNYYKGSSSAPVAADVDNDGLVEIFVGTGYDASNYEARLLCITHTGAVKPGWPKMVGPYSVGGTPALYDLNNDNKLDVVIRLKDLNTSDINGIYAYNFDGTLLPNFPFPVPSGHPYAGVSIGDIDGDNEVEIAFGTVEAVSLGKICAWNLDGTMLPGFPRGVWATWVDGNTAIADVTGDGIPEVIGGTNQGKMYAITATGDSAAGFPLSSEATSLNAFNSNPTMIDIDGDGDVELFAPCNDRKIYAWDTPGLWSADPKKVWSTYKGNSRRDGTQTLDIPVGISTTGTTVPDRYALSQNYPNPFNPATTIRFALPGNSFTRLSVYNSLGERVADLVKGMLSAGEYSYSWDAGKLSSGVYFYKLEAGDFSEVKRMVLVK